MRKFTLRRGLFALIWGKGLPEPRIEKMVNTKKYIVMERSKIEQVIKELRLQSTQNASARAAEIGKLLGVSKIITGEYIGVRVSLRLVDVESGGIEAAVTMSDWVIEKDKKGRTIKQYNMSQEELAKKLLEALLN